ncbi:MAG: MotA/TolQ/ExbB proton channel [Planctomycetes bacterium]|nr:MotA/TolQ/ExbB proton channel [Planctomycetota bacterium]
MHISAQLLKQLSELSTPVILCAFIGHLVMFVMLWMAYRHNLRTIAQNLDDFTRGLRNRSVLDRSLPLSDQIEAFLTDVKDALDIPARSAERQELAIRMSILDEKRRYLHAIRFETIYNVWRSMIEAYPMAGILGTVLAIGAALQAENQNGNATVNAIVRNFGESIWSTFSALAAAVVLIFLNSWIEPAFARLSENREHVRDMVARAKRELAMSATGGSNTGS